MRVDPLYPVNVKPAILIVGHQRQKSTSLPGTRRLRPSRCHRWSPHRHSRLFRQLDSCILWGQSLSLARETARAASESSADRGIGRAGSFGVRSGHVQSLLAEGRFLSARTAGLGNTLTLTRRWGCPAAVRLKIGWGASENFRKLWGEMRHQAPKRKARSKTNPKNQSPGPERFACAVSPSIALRSSGPCPGADPQRTSSGPNTALCLLIGVYHARSR